MWNKKIHVASSMQKKEGQWSMFIGRWQPLHYGHKQMFEQILNEGGKVLIAIRDMEADENNPFSANEVYENISKEYFNNPNVKVMIMPDICSVNFGRGVGYDIVEYMPPEEIASISATGIRKNSRI
jgi:cytidyltransferase-like protein